MQVFCYEEFRMGNKKTKIKRMSIVDKKKFATKKQTQLDVKEEKYKYHLTKFHMN
jgi:hypothetical protein